MTELIYNEDSNNLAAFHPDHDRLSGEVVDERVDTVAGLGVTRFALCVNDMRTNYASEVWESYWDGFDPESPDDQEFFHGCRPDVIRAIRPWLADSAGLAGMGIDYVERTLSRCRKRQMLN